MRLLFITKFLCFCPNSQFQTVAVSSNNVQYRLLVARQDGNVQNTYPTKDNLGEKVIGNIFHNVNDDDEYNVRNANDVNTCELVLCEQAF